jgi:hypothetical protein
MEPLILSTLAKKVFFLIPVEGEKYDKCHCSLNFLKTKLVDFHVGVEMCTSYATKAACNNFGQWKMRAVQL